VERGLISVTPPSLGRRSNQYLIHYIKRRRADSGKKWRGQRGKLWDDMWDVAHVLAGPRFFDRGELVERMEKAAVECSDILDCLQPDDLPVPIMQSLTGRLASVGELLHRMSRQPSA
jgi:hypothetical protein